ncbi:MAG: TGS domain-containing protein [Candidatus Odinarchaeota archaeon]
MSEPLIITEDLIKEYHLGEVTVKALAGVDISVQPGSFVVILGPSGSGKTTLLNLVGGIDLTTGGKIGFLDFKEDWAISKQIVRVARTSDAILLVVDLSQDVGRQLDFLIEQLEQANLIVNGQSLYRLAVIATKGDLPGSKDNFKLLKDKTPLPVYPTSIKNEYSLEKLKKNLFEVLEVIRVYTKPPAKKTDYKRPFVCPRGTTIRELAESIHRDFVELFRHAKVWGTSVEFPGQQVGLEHELHDSDVVEITLQRKK